MPGRSALRWLGGQASVVVAGLCVVLAGCAQPGTQAPKPQAAKLAVGTSDISTACGYVWELTAYRRRANLSAEASMAETGAQKLAAVYAQDQTGIYQGDSIGALLGDTISLLQECGLTRPERTLQHALTAHR
ncbi:MAG: hypothetical protein JO244_10850 [Solirubrobacterales bacterium]|nr:hypothetical protein [Solirubrobacterales bacterium]